MRPLIVEFAHESIEPGLLLHGVHARRPGSLGLERAMYALAAAVLVRITGPDALDAYAEPQPQDRKPGEIVEPVGLAKGRPLSLLIASGKPHSLKSRTKASMTGTSFVD